MHISPWSLNALIVNATASDHAPPFCSPFFYHVLCYQNIFSTLIRVNLRRQIMCMGCSNKSLIHSSCTIICEALKIQYHSAVPINSTMCYYSPPDQFMMVNLFIRRFSKLSYNGEHIWGENFHSIWLIVDRLKFVLIVDGLKFVWTLIYLYMAEKLCCNFIKRHIHSCALILRTP